jgi:hypothetical protein
VKGREAALNQFFLRLYGLWEAAPRSTLQTSSEALSCLVYSLIQHSLFKIHHSAKRLPPWVAIKEWIPDDEPDLNWFNQERDPTGAEPECYDQSPDWRPVEIPLGDGRTLVLEDS